MVISNNQVKLFKMPFHIYANINKYIDISSSEINIPSNQYFSSKSAFDTFICDKSVLSYFALSTNAHLSTVTKQLALNEKCTLVLV